MEDRSIIGIYGNGLFQDQTIPYADQLSQMRASGYTTLVLWALHVHDTGDFYYNDNLMVQNGKIMTSDDPDKMWLNPEFTKLVTAVKQGGSVDKVVLSMGPFVSDFKAMYNNQTMARKNLQALLNAMPIDAIDFDYEGGGDIDMIVGLTEMVDDTGLAVTYCPYMDQQFWLECLARVYADKGRQVVAWYNLQCYDGGGGNDPAQWAQNIAAYGQPLGIDDPYGFVVPGYWVQQDHPGKSYWGKCPDQVQSQFAALRQQGLKGGWLWNSADVFSYQGSGLCGQQDMSLKAYAQAVISGLGG